MLVIATDKDNRVIKKSIIKRSRTTNHSDKDRRVSVSIRTSLLTTDQVVTHIMALYHKSQLSDHRDDMSELKVRFSLFFSFAVLAFFLSWSLYSVLS